MRMATGCRRKPSGKRPPGADPAGTGFRGAIPSSTRGRIITAAHTATTPVLRVVITRTTTAMGIRTRVRWDRLRRMDTACLTWPEMYGSGAMTGMTATITIHRREATQRGRLRARPASYAAAVGAATPTAAVPPFATNTTRTTATRGSGLSCPPVCEVSPARTGSVRSRRALRSRADWKERPTGHRTTRHLEGRPLRHGGQACRPCPEERTGQSPSLQGA